MVETKTTNVKKDISGNNTRWREKGRVAQKCRSQNKTIKILKKLNSVQTINNIR